MTNDEKFNLITRNLEETLTTEELKALIESGKPLKHYIGFEISGKLHIGYLFTCLKVKDLQDAGADVTIWLADLHSAINDKLGGDLEVIKRMAREYFQPAFSALLDSVGGDSSKVDFKLCSETYADNPDFWLTLLKVAKATTLARTKRSITIMGREESDDSVETAKLFYPIMQAADIFLLNINIAHAGMDQRKVHVVARDAASALGREKPVAIHHPILLSLAGQTTNEGEADELAMKNKMSKSKPGSGIFIHDSAEEIKEKIKNAFAPEGIIEGNPIINWTKNLIFYGGEGSLTISRKEEHGGEVTYINMNDLERDYTNKKLHPMDLKAAVADWLIEKLEPTRKHFEDPEKQKALLEIESLTSR